MLAVVVRTRTASFSLHQCKFAVINLYKACSPSNFLNFIYATDHARLQLRGKRAIKNNIHLMSAPEGNSEFCFPKSLNVSRDEVEGNIETRGKTKPATSRGSRY